MLGGAGTDRGRAGKAGKVPGLVPVGRGDALMPVGTDDVHGPPSARPASMGRLGSAGAGSAGGASRDTGGPCCYKCPHSGAGGILSEESPEVSSGPCLINSSETGMENKV